MRNLLTYAAQCEQELRRLGIRYAADVTYAVNTRAQKRLGVCKKTGDCYRIEIAAALLEESSPELLLRETILHELLHTCHGCMKHTGRWKALAERVNAAYGYHITRTAEENELPPDLRPKARYRIVCPHCGTVYERVKRSPVVDHPERYRCGKCKQPLI